MKIICSKADLVKGLNTVSKAVPTRTTLTILECILIDASATDIRLTANDNEIGIETTIPGQIVERGRVAVDAKVLTDMARTLPDNDVTIECDERFVTQITCEKAHFAVPGRSGDDFPYLPVIPRESPVSISQFTMRELIRQTIFSTMESETNRMMGGELFEVRENRLRMVSLDGHRISVRHVELREPSEKDISVIIPAKTLNEIAKILSGSVDDMMEVFVSDNYIVFDFEQTTMVSQLMDGQFFKIDQMLSSDYETKVSINKQELAESITRASQMINEADKRPIILDIHDQVFNMSVKSMRGNFEEDLSMVKEGMDIQIAFNPRFILDALRVIDDERVDIYMIAPRSPCFIRDEEQNYIYLILPVSFNAG